MIRNKKTNLSRGFGFVHFEDKEGMDACLAMDGTVEKVV